MREEADLTEGHLRVPPTSGYSQEQRQGWTWGLLFHTLAGPDAPRGAVAPPTGAHTMPRRSPLLSHPQGAAEKNSVLCPSPFSRGASCLPCMEAPGQDLSRICKLLVPGEWERSSQGRGLGSGRQARAPGQRLLCRGCLLAPCQCPEAGKATRDSAVGLQHRSPHGFS